VVSRAEMRLPSPAGGEVILEVTAAPVRDGRAGMQ
jgi:hypothetical protein